MLSIFLVCTAVQIKLHLIDRLGQVPFREDGGKRDLRNLISEGMFGRLPTTTFEHPEGPLPSRFFKQLLQSKLSH